MINLLVRLVAVSNCLSIVIASAQGVPKIRMFRTPLAVPTLKIRKKEKRDAKVETTKIRVGKSLKKVKLDLSVAGVKCLCLRGHDGPLYTDELTWIRSTEKDELQDEEHLKRIAPPPTANTVGAIGLIFELGIHRVNINGATVAIFKFPSRTQKNEL